MKNRPFIFCIIGIILLGVVGCIIDLIPRDLHNNNNKTEETFPNTTENANKTSESDEMIQLLKDARIESENMNLWQSIFYSYNYNEIVNKEHIRGPEITKLYKGPSDNKNVVEYYFLTGKSDEGFYYHGFDNVAYSMTDQTMSFGSGVFQSRFLDDVLEELDTRGAEYLGYITIEYPAPYFPTPHMTERKQEVINILEDEIKNFIIGHVENAEDYGYDLGLEPGEYPVYIMDFMDADYSTEFIIYDEKNKQYAGNSMMFADDPKYCHPMSPHLFMADDGDLGGIMHSELFSKLSIYNFTLVINESTGDAK